MAIANGAVVDIHSHVMTPEAQELARPFFTPEKDPFFAYMSPSTRAYNTQHIPEVMPGLTLPDVRLRDMDRMGVDVQAISVMPPQYFYWVEPDLGVRLSRMVNDHLSDIVHGHPDRFVGLGTLPLQDVELALTELEHVVRDLWFTGLEICTNVNGLDYDDARFLPFFEKVVEYDLLLVVHPHGFFDGRRLADHYLINTVGMPMDSTVFIARMIFGGVLERFPELKVCVTHGGGYLPFAPARFDHAYEAREDCREHIDRPPSTYLAQMYFDTVVFDPEMLGRLVSRWGADHVLLGTDYPFDMSEPDPLGLLDQVDGLGEADRAMIAGGNAARLLRLD